MFRILLALILLSSASYAAPRPDNLQAVTPENIPMSAGSVGNVFVPTPSTVVTVTVPYFSDTYIASGDPLWVCDNPSRCGSTFPTGTVTQTGWVFMPSGRMLKGNLQVSTSIIYVYARPQDMVSSTAANIGAFEWSYRQQVQ